MSSLLVESKHQITRITHFSTIVIRQLHPQMHPSLFKGNQTIQCSSVLLKLIRHLDNTTDSHDGQQFCDRC